RRLHQSAHHAERRGLACAVGAEDRDERASADGEVDAVEDLDLLVGSPDVPQFEKWDVAIRSRFTASQARPRVRVWVLRSRFSGSGPAMDACARAAVRRLPPD